MTTRKRVRSVAGLAAVFTLLGLIAADTIHPDVALSLEDKVILISLVSALLGVDLALSELPITFKGATTDRDDGTPRPSTGNVDGHGGRDDE